MKFSMKKKYKMIRNIFICIGIFGGFIIWLFVPAAIKNSALIHVGNGELGSKWGLLVLLPLPLFTLICSKEDVAFHGDDEEVKRVARTKIYRNQMVIAICMAILVIGLMALGIVM